MLYTCAVAVSDTEKEYQVFATIHLRAEVVSCEVTSWLC